MAVLYAVQTPDQLSALIQAYRKQAHLTQREVAIRLGVSQQTYSSMERHADKVGVSNLLRLLNILGVQLTLSKPSPATLSDAPTDPNKPVW